MSVTPSVAERRALEALRAGVPNGDAVKALVSHQDHVTSEFDDKLEHAANLHADAPVGFVISGGFGTGKSHLLEELHQRAQSANYVSSKVVISKETPLHMPAKVVQSAVQTMQAKDIPQDVLLEMTMRLKTDKEAYPAFKRWCGSRESGISVMYRSLLELRATAPTDVDAIDLLVRYWSGETVLIGEIRKKLKAARLWSSPTENVLAADRPWQTVRFVARLCQEFGFRGWVIFLDEVELISKYGAISRARAYEQLGRWLGLRRDHRVPGTCVVATVINDFAPQVLDQREDRWLVRERLTNGSRPSDPAGVPFAEQAMHAIDNAITLHDVKPEQLELAHETLRTAHSHAYQWNAPPLDVEFRPFQPMRLYVRRWINEWDLKRLYPGERLDFQGEKIVIDYDEDREFGRSPRA